MIRVSCKQLGFTLVELMIALVLGLLLVIAALSVLITSLTQLSNTQSFSEILDNGRVAIALLGKDVTHAGFMGQLSGQNLVLGSNLTLEAGAVSSECTGGGVNNATFPTVGINATFRMLWGANLTGANAMGCIDDGRAGTDVIQIKRLIGQEDESNAIVTNGNVYMAANSNTAVIFNGATGLVAAEPTNAEYFEYQHRVYYVANVNRYGINDFPVLVRETLAVTSGSEVMIKEEIAEGVEDLHFLYGLDDDGDGAVDRYATAAQITDDEWDNVDFARVLSVQVAMLVRAIEADPALTQHGAATYNYGSRTVTSANDGIRRKVLSATVAIRNHQIANGG
ncbi:type IV minor pilin protein PilW [Neiella marina]|uniref:Type IV minor pilin protein PilW n=1 Tax=Neiella marina TaxID=508461 RepID=A0A8J2XNC5_9GAMM|nr:PilW family protein [Neiella marina]GGA70971.1 type IV minor pilin protein PilW [Neiella marina]